MHCMARVLKNCLVLVSKTRIQKLEVNLYALWVNFITNGTKNKELNCKENSLVLVSKKSIQKYE